jgi:hypothetical protein
MDITFSPPEPTLLYGIIVQNNPVNFIDPLGLARTTIDAGIQQAAARGDVAELQAILEEAVATNEERALARSLIERLNSKATDIISKECRGSVRKEFPGEMLDKTLEQIYNLARSGDRAARTAKKLLTESRFKK